MFIPRGVRRAAHPARTLKRGVTPKTVKKLQRATHPIDNAVYGVQRSLNTKRRKPAAPDTARRAVVHCRRARPVGNVTADRPASRETSFVLLVTVLAPRLSE